MDFFKNYISTLKGTFSSTSIKREDAPFIKFEEGAEMPEQDMLLNLLKLVFKAVQYPENSNFRPGSFVNENHKMLCQEETKVIEEKRKVMIRLFRKICSIARTQTIVYITTSLNVLLVNNMTFQMIEAFLLFINELGSVFNGNENMSSPLDHEELKPLFNIVMSANIPHFSYIPVALMYLNVVSTYNSIAKNMKDNGEIANYFLKFYLSEKALGSDIKVTFIVKLNII